MEDDLDGQGISQEIGDNVQGGVAQVEKVDVDAFSGSSASPGHANGLTLECSHENE